MSRAGGGYRSRCRLWRGHAPLAAAGTAPESSAAVEALVAGAPFVAEVDHIQYVTCTKVPASPQHWSAARWWITEIIGGPLVTAADD